MHCCWWFAIFYINHQLVLIILSAYVHSPASCSSFGILYRRVVGGEAARTFIWNIQIQIIILLVIIPAFVLSSFFLRTTTQVVFSGQKSLAHFLLVIDGQIIGSRSKHCWQHTWASCLLPNIQLGQITGMVLACWWTDNSWVKSPLAHHWHSCMVACWPTFLPVDKHFIVHWWWAVDRWWGWLDGTSHITGKVLLADKWQTFNWVKVKSLAWACFDIHSIGSNLWHYGMIT